MNKKIDVFCGNCFNYVFIDEFIGEKNVECCCCGNKFGVVMNDHSHFTTDIINGAQTIESDLEGEF